MPLLLIGFLLIFSGCLKYDNTIISGLKCDHRIHPINIDIEAPMFSWQMETTRRGAAQTAYQVIVSDSRELIGKNQGNIWDSGKVNSSQSVHIPFSGSPLQSSKEYWWKVRVWDESGNESPWSKTAQFETAFLNPNQWQAQWIGRPVEEKSVSDFNNLYWIWHPSGNIHWKMVHLEKSFSGENVTSARVWVSVDNSYEIFINDTSLGGHREYTPNPATRFFEYEMTGHIHGGDNIFRISAVQTTHERNAGAIARIILAYSDGTETIINSDSTWKASLAKNYGFVSTQKEWEPAIQAVAIEKYPGRHWGELTLPYQSPRSVLVRNEVEIPKRIKKAKVHVSGLGGYTFYINGQKVGNDLLSPGWTHYGKRIQYQTYNVTSMLQRGKNCFGALLGSLWWSGDMGFRQIPQFSEGPLQFIMQMQVDYNDGTTDVFTTNQYWKTQLSPITENSIYDGETWDARLEIAGWNQPGLMDSNWEPALVIPGDKSLLVAEQFQPIRVTREIKPVSVTEIAPGKFIFDMGENIAGWTRIRARGNPGDTIILRFAEVLNDDGTLDTAPLRTAKATDRYIVKGTGWETWEPSFTYHGFQFVEITGFPGKPSAENLTGIVFHTDAPRVGQLETSNPFLNLIYNNVYRTQTGNMHSVVTDCPQRDERLGWAGDANIFTKTMYYNMDMYLYFRKYLRDLRDSQLPNGEMPNFAPDAFSFNPGPPGWGDAVVMMPWRTWLFTGDTAILTENYPAMLQWHQTVVDRSENNLLEWGGFGDWVSLVHTPANPIGSLYYYYSTTLLAHISRIIGKHDEAVRLEELAVKIKSAFNEKYYNPETQQYWANTQTALVMPLAMGLVPEQHRDAVARKLAENIRENDNHLNTGFLGTQFLLQTLSELGYHELAYTLASHRTYPSWGYMIEKGATTVWENWNADTKGPEMNSRNHPPFAVIGEWMYAYLAGIKPDPEYPGFKQFTIEPRPVVDLQWVKAEYHSPYGKIVSNWEWKDSRFVIEITVPANSRARVIIPAKDAGSVSENGKKLTEIKHARILSENDGKVVFLLKAGKYLFVAEG